MRHSSPKPNLEEGQQTVFFQIADGTARHACSLKTKFQTQQQASRYLRQNWIRLEKMARDCLARDCFENGQINLVMMGSHAAKGKLRTPRRRELFYQIGQIVTETACPACKEKSVLFGPPRGTVAGPAEAIDDLYGSDSEQASMQGAGAAMGPRSDAYDEALAS